MFIRLCLILILTTLASPVAHSANGEMKLRIANAAMGTAQAQNGSQIFSPPRYLGYEFLANTAQEIYSSSYPHTPSYPSYPRSPRYASYPFPINARDWLVKRAHDTCQFLGFDRARFVKSTNVIYAPDSLITIDEDGFAAVEYFSTFKTIKPTFIDTLDCIKK